LFRRAILGALIIVALWVGFATAQGQAPLMRRLGSSLVPVGRKAPAFEVPALGGGKHALATINRNKPVLLNFWFHG
jgi:hypothetical protein